ncbi:MAG: DMT family transporter [Promethearchaeota archaeon]|jgi:drug/metabolite transporter (DMT)-like permease
MNEKKHKKKIKVIANLFLIFTTILWGTTFIITKTLTQDIPIFLYLGLRYLLGTIGFIPLFFHFKYFNKKILLVGILTGFIYYLLMVFQTYGLQTTTAGKAGFITGLSTVIVPFITWFLYKKKVRYRIWIAVGLSVIGMALLLLENESGIIIGDFLVLGCAVFCAIFIVLNDKNVRIFDVYLYTIIQLITLTLLCFTSSLILRESYDLFSSQLDFWLIMLYMGFGATSLTFIFQNWGQKHQGPSQTAIIFTLEPVFAALFGFLIGNEILTLFNWIGMGLIFTAILITVLKINLKKNN